MLFGIFNDLFVRVKFHNSLFNNFSCCNYFEIISGNYFMIYENVWYEMGSFNQMPSRISLEQNEVRMNIATRIAYSRVFLAWKRHDPDKCNAFANEKGWKKQNAVKRIRRSRASG